MSPSKDIERRQSRCCPAPDRSIHAILRRASNGNFFIYCECCGGFGGGQPTRSKAWADYYRRVLKRPAGATR